MGPPSRCSAPATARGFSEAGWKPGDAQMQSLPQESGAALFSTDISGKEVGFFLPTILLKRLWGCFFFPFFFSPFSQ